MSAKRIDSIRVDAVRFLKSKNLFKENELLKDVLKSVFFTEMLTGKQLTTQDRGIFFFGALISHTNNFVLLVDSNGWKIEDHGSIVEIEDMIEFFRRNRVGDVDVQRYMKKWAQIHEYNE